MPHRLILCLIALLLLTAPLLAQDTPPTPAPILPEVVRISAHDNLTLVGDFYRVAPERPTVLLLHQLYTTRRSWSSLIPSLLDAGYNVLAVDLRGYGATGGRINWRSAVEDVQAWLNWLRAEGGVNPDQIHVMGSSMGSALAVVGCANDALCRSAITLSAGRDYFGISILDALTESMSGRRTLMMYAERDRYPALGMPTIIASAPEGSLEVLSFTGNAHGMELLRRERETILPVLLAWLNN